MSWNNCPKCVFIPRSSFTSALFKVLVTLKLLHGSRTGAKGSTLEDIAMHMIKHFCLDGDVKSQVLASLKFGVKMHFIQKRKDKFSLIMPASSIHLAPCKYKNEETERIQCIYPSAWYSNTGDACNQDNPDSGCGRRRRPPGKVTCCDSDEEDSACDEQDYCPARKKQHNECSRCAPPPKKKCHRQRSCNPCSHSRKDSRPTKTCGHSNALPSSNFPHDARRNCRCCVNKRM